MEKDSKQRFQNRVKNNLNLFQYNLDHLGSITNLSKSLVHTSQDVLLFFEDFYLESLIWSLDEDLIEFYISLDE